MTVRDLKTVLSEFNDNLTVKLYNETFETYEDFGVGDVELITYKKFPYTKESKHEEFVGLRL